MACRRPADVGSGRRRPGPDLPDQAAAQRSPGGRGEVQAADVLEAARRIGRRALLDRRCFGREHPDDRVRPSGAFLQAPHPDAPRPRQIAALLLDPERPVQIVIAGKAHPADDGGKALIQEMVRFTDDPAVRHRIVFLPDYDMELGRTMVQGCDVWLNNPLRRLEACGTSGMKAALNGGLNVSVLDGWWDEWFDGANGWGIPAADGVEDADRRDELEAAPLYDPLRASVAPLFYDRDAA